jgi:hypothetical protein
MATTLAMFLLTKAHAKLIVDVSYNVEALVCLIKTETSQLSTSSHSRDSDIPQATSTAVIAWRKILGHRCKDSP